MMKMHVKVNNIDKVIQEKNLATEKVLETCGILAETHAKSNITAAGRVGEIAGGTLRDSITHVVEGNVCYIGTDVEYAVFNELGTGIYASEGNGRKDPWVYRDDKTGKFYTTKGMKPIHFLKRAIEEHVDEYRRIAEQELQKG